MAVLAVDTYIVCHWHRNSNLNMCQEGRSQLGVVMEVEEEYKGVEHTVVEEEHRVLHDAVKDDGVVYSAVDKVGEGESKEVEDKVVVVEEAEGEEEGSNCYFVDRSNCYFGHRSNCYFYHNYYYCSNEWVKV